MGWSGKGFAAFKWRNGTSNYNCNFILQLGTFLFVFIVPVLLYDPKHDHRHRPRVPSLSLQRFEVISSRNATEIQNIQSVINSSVSVSSVKQNPHKIKRDVGQYSFHSTKEKEREKDETDSASLTLRNKLNYNSSVLSPNKNANHILTETSTVWDRSLIPNSFFSPQQTALSRQSNGTWWSNNGHGQAESDLETSGSSTSGERSRRSPFSNVNRAALHRSGPPPPPIRSIPRFRPHPHPHLPNLMPMPRPLNYLPPQQLAPQPLPSPVNPLPVPVPMPRPLPYTQVQGQSYDFSGYGSGYGSAPEVQSPSHYSRIKRPAPPHMGRRMPGAYNGGRPMPFPPRSPLPRPRGKGRPIPGPGHPPHPPYSYPKNAANIQDILTYFNENDNQVPIRSSKGQLSFNSDSRPKGEFSRELDDVQSSLLKDIREFAKRPTLIGSQTPDSATSTRKLPPPSYKPYKPPPSGSSHSDEGIYEPKPKPVRELAKLNSNSKHRYEDSGESLNLHSERKAGNRYRVKDASYEDNKSPYRSRYNNYKPYGHAVDDSDEGPIRIHNGDHGVVEVEYMDKNKKNKNRSKYSSSSSLRESYRPHKYPSEESDEWEQYPERIRKPSASFTPPNKPVVLKHPYGPYKYENELKASRPYHSYWGSGEKDTYSSVPRVKPPSITYSPSRTKSPSYYKNQSPEIIEDVVEIHTDPSYRLEMEEREREEKARKTRLQRLYLEYLERKLESQRASEAATAATSTTTKSNPMRMKIHIYPNENVKVADSNHGHGSLGVNSNNYYAPPHVSYSNSNPTIVSSPTHQYKQLQQHHYLGSHSHRVGVTGPQMGVDKNKNVVLHLHVHRRHGHPSTGGMMAEASEIYTSTAKPLTYTEIFDTYQDHNHNHPTHKGSSSSLDISDDKSVSMELPIQDEKIDDVLHTLLSLRQQRNN